ncbi:MAG: four-helix bundle copper-binding protein [Candidatus Omnitrophica bacterium]|nr:four-helix bundle copper-binding protein [Candidatus Omnitrophota bacterium]
MSHKQYQECIDICNECVTTCEHCASECLHEKDIAKRVSLY